MDKTKVILITAIVIAVIGAGFYFDLFSLKPEASEADLETELSEITPAEEEVSAGEEFQGKIIKLTVNYEDGFKPNIFTVKAGEVIKIELTCTDMVGYVMQFRDPKIDLILVGGPKGSGQEVDSVEYTVPTDLSANEYEFYDELAEMNNLSPFTGKMIVE